MDKKTKETMRNRKKNTKKFRIALIAHDGMKAEMLAFARDNIKRLKEAQLTATKTTGSHIKKAGLKVSLKLSGPMGGDAQVASAVASGNMDAVLFFRDPLGKHAHEPDIQMLMRLCDVHNIALASNHRTAELVLKGLIPQNDE